MRRPNTSIWDVPSVGSMQALAITAVFFFFGGLAGCVLAASVKGGGTESLIAYIQGFLTATKVGSIASPLFLPLLWETLRWPILTLLLGFTALGLIGLPILFAVRGFLMAFSITSLVHMFGSAGGVLAFLIFGISGLVTTPVFFVLGVQSFLIARNLAGYVTGEGRKALSFGKTYFWRCGICACALCVCVLLEYFVVPALVSGMAGALVI